MPGQPRDHGAWATRCTVLTATPCAARSGASIASIKDSARVTVDALDALGRAEEAKALRERNGITASEKPRP